MVSTLIRGIVYAADIGIDVINVSRTHGENPIREFPRGMALLQRMFAYAARQGSLLVFGVGNHGVDLDHAGNAIAVPAESSNGMSIGATTVSDALASYSNYGVSAVTMVAPGGGVPTDPFPATLVNENVLVACSVHSVAEPAADDDLFAGDRHELRGAHGRGRRRTRDLEQPSFQRKAPAGQIRVGQLRGRFGGAGNG